MDIITIKLLKQDIIPLMDMLMFNIFSLEDVMAMDEECDFSDAILFYSNEIEKLKPVFKEVDTINYAIYDHCNFDYSVYTSYMLDVEKMGLGFEL